MQEGKLLGHVISNNEIKIYLDRVSTIQKIDLPRSKKEIQPFIGRVKYLRRSIPNIVEILIFITNMLIKKR